jgi:hypothetical protein
MAATVSQAKARQEARARGNRRFHVPGSGGSAVCTRVLRVLALVAFTGCIARTARLHAGINVDDGRPAFEVGATVGIGGTKEGSRMTRASVVTTGVATAARHAGIDVGFDILKLPEEYVEMPELPEPEGDGPGWRWGLVSRLVPRPGPPLQVDLGGRFGLIVPVRDRSISDRNHERRVHALGVEVMLARALALDEPDRWFGRMAVTYEWFSLRISD